MLVVVASIALPAGGAEAQTLVGPSYNVGASPECSSSGNTTRLSGNVRLEKWTNSVTGGLPHPFAQQFTTTLPNCSGGVLQNAEIYLKGWRLGRWSRSRYESQISIAVRRIAFTPGSSSGALVWELDLDSKTAPIDETSYDVNFEIVGVTNSASSVQRISHQCKGFAGCSSTTSNALPPFKTRGLALAAVTLETDGVDPGPTDVTADVTIFSETATSLDSTMQCAFDRNGTTTCTTEEVVISGVDAEMSADHRAVKTLSSATLSAINSANNSDSFSPKFRLCGQERFHLNRPTPNPPGPPQGGTNDTTWSMWAGATDGEYWCGHQTPNMFWGNWWYFFGSNWADASACVPSTGIPCFYQTGQSSGLPFDADATILATMVK